MSTKKIEGWIDDLSGNSPSEYALGNGAGYCDFWEGECPAVSQIHTRIATLVIHELERERVYTESEVRAVIQRMEEQAEANMRTSIQFPGYREVSDTVVHDMIDDACEALGIVLDPA